MTSRAPLTLLFFALALAAPAAATVSTDRTPLLPVLSEAGEAGEYWDVTAVFESGHRFFSRFLVTNLGPGEQTAVGVGHVVFRDGKVSTFKYGKRAGEWTLADDRRRIKIGKATLKLFDGPCQVKVKSQKRALGIFLDFHPEQIGHWRIARDHEVAVALPVPVSGTVLVPPMQEPLSVRGWIAVTHVVQAVAEDRLVRRRVEVIARDGEWSVYATEVRDAGGSSHRWLLEGRGGTVRERTDVEYAEDFRLADAGRKNRLPRSIRLRDSDQEYALTPRREWLRWDPLDIIPQPFRLVMSLRARPQLVWAEARLRRGGNPAEHDAVLVVTFVQETPTP